MEVPPGLAGERGAGGERDGGKGWARPGRPLWGVEGSRALLPEGQAQEASSWEERRGILASPASSHLAKWMGFLPLPHVLPCLESHPHPQRMLLAFTSAQCHLDSGEDREGWWDAPDVFIPQDCKASHQTAALLCPGSRGSVGRLWAPPFLNLGLRSF